jgi:hypothetical protein
MVFNKLPQNIRQISENVKSFKGMLEGFLVARAFYSMDEYILASRESN